MEARKKKKAIYYCQVSYSLQYFEKTFEVYTKLWKFQQTHRPILEDKANYGLKRWEVGEIASKIGQLYYHYQ